MQIIVEGKTIISKLTIVAKTYLIWNLLQIYDAVSCLEHAA